MLLSSTDKAGASGGGGGSVEELVRQIGRLVRHPSYRRGGVVSPMLLRHLPSDGGYGWRGEAALRDRLSRAKLDPTTLDHLVGSTRAEFARLRGPSDA